MAAVADPLSRALDDAVAGRHEALRSLLSRGSHLPGTRMNSALADAFAHECRARRGLADGVALALARMTAGDAPGATAREFLPVCGLYGLAARAAAEPGVRESFVAELHARADDSRFRVRDAVVQGLANVGHAAGDELVRAVASWMDGYFHAAAVLRALATEAWLGAVHDATAVAARLDDAFSLLLAAPRAAARWPGHKELSGALAETPAPLAVRFGVPLFDLFERWAATPDPDLRALVEQIVGARKLAGRFSPELARVNRALLAARPPPRNPDHDVGPSRDRSGDRSRGRKRRGG